MTDEPSTTNQEEMKTIYSARVQMCAWIEVAAQALHEAQQLGEGPDTKLDDDTVMRLREAEQAISELHYDAHIKLEDKPK